MSRPNTAEDFHHLVHPEPNSGCWLWGGSARNERYGSLNFNKRPMLAHVVAYTLAKGPVPKGMVVDHLCRVTFCCNPDHLEAVTQTINMQRSAPATKTNCVYGHPYADGMEYYYRKDGGGIRYRRCLTCYRMKYPRSSKKLAREAKEGR